MLHVYGSNKMHKGRSFVESVFNLNKQGQADAKRFQFFWHGTARRWILHGPWTL